MNLNFDDAEIKIIANLDRAIRHLNAFPSKSPPVTMEDVREHAQNFPGGCDMANACEVCEALKGREVKEP